MTKDRKTILSFWNTGLTPPTVNKNVQGKRSVSEIVSVLTQMVQHGARIIGLCEICENDLNDESFIAFLLQNNLKCQSFYKKEGGLVWDIALIYDDSYFIYVDYSYLSADVLASHKKLGIKINGFLFDEHLRLYISHFPGMWTGLAEKANMFKELVTHMHAKGDVCEHSIAMGDYNIELCSDGMLDSISRSREFAIADKKIYSPFVRHLGEKYERGHPREISGTLRCGTKWEFFDFISTTRHFYQSGAKLKIDDFKCGIWDELLPVGKTNKDHLPVYITIEKGGE
jgi:hypothetical protein